MRSFPGIIAVGSFASLCVLAACASQRAGSGGESGSPAVEAGPIERTRVYKADGSKQCEPGTAIPPERMVRELEEAGIEVFSMSKQHDGRLQIAMCGAGTGMVNVYEIARTDLAAARTLGYEPFPPADR